MKLQLLSDYIAEHYGGNQSAFGRAQGVQRAQVNTWIRQGYCVVGDILVAPKRELKAP